jgi:hypothetical protein
MIANNAFTYSYQELQQGLVTQKEFDEFHYNRQKESLKLLEEKYKKKPSSKDLTTITIYKNKLKIEMNESEKTHYNKFVKSFEKSAQFS